LNSFRKNFSNFTDSFHTNNNNWTLIKKLRSQNPFQFESKSLVIYPYSISHNLLKEVLLKLGFQFVLTNEIKKANLIIGLKKHLKQNFKLTNLARQKNIPIYGLNQISLYQITKLFQLIIDS
jgi:hypothetical protein